MPIGAVNSVVHFPFRAGQPLGGAWKVTPNPDGPLAVPADGYLHYQVTRQQAYNQWLYLSAAEPFPTTQGCVVAFQVRANQIGGTEVKFTLAAGVILRFTGGGRHVMYQRSDSSFHDLGPSGIRPDGSWHSVIMVLTPSSVTLFEDGQRIFTWNDSAVGDSVNAAFHMQVLNRGASLSFDLSDVYVLPPTDFVDVATPWDYAILGMQPPSQIMSFRTNPGGPQISFTDGFVRFAAQPQTERNQWSFLDVPRSGAAHSIFTYWLRVNQSGGSETKITLPGDNILRLVNQGTVASWNSWDGAFHELATSAIVAGRSGFAIVTLVTASNKLTLLEDGVVLYERAYPQTNAWNPGLSVQHLDVSTNVSVDVGGFRTFPSTKPKYSVTIDDGNVLRLFQAAQTGPFLEAEIHSAAGRGKARVTYNWLSSALNCDPNDNDPFVWVFIKTADGRLALSPKAQYSGMTLYAGVRVDGDWYAQVQTPSSADWLTAVGVDEKFSLTGAGVLSIALQGSNNFYLAVNQTSDQDGTHAGYRMRSVQNVLVDDAVFTLSNLKVLQPGIVFLESYTVTTDDVAAVLDAYGLVLSQQDQIALAAALPQITPQLLADYLNSGPSDPFHPAQDRRLLTAHALSATTVSEFTVGAVVGAVIGGVIGLTLAGPVGALAGAGAGLAVGANIGAGLTIHELHEDPTGVINIGVPQVAATQVSITPVGGPYVNQHLWEDLFRFTKFPQIGDLGLPKAGCLSAPGAGNTAQVWLPSSSTVTGFIFDPVTWPGIQGPTGPLYMAIFVIVKLRNGNYQLRLHPDAALLNGPDRPNHSQLTQGSRIQALIGSDSLHVYAAGELYCTDGQVIRGINAKTGHYFNLTPTFDSEVFATTKRMLQALGYDITGLLCGDDFWSWVRS